MVAAACPPLPQQGVSYSLRVEPAKHFINWQQDPFANFQARLVFPEKTTEFKVTVDLVVEMAVYNPFDFFLEPTAEKFPSGTSRARRGTGALPALRATDAAGAGLPGEDRPPQARHDRLPGRPEPAGAARCEVPDPHGARRADPEETLQLASGSCRDSGWLLVQLLRRLGLAARFVSGYLIQLKPDEGPGRPERHRSRLHRPAPGARSTCPAPAGSAWIRPPACWPAKATSPRVHAPALGRRADRGPGRRGRGGVRPPHAGHAHPRIAARHPALHRGAVGGVLALGDAVDRELQAGDVRLTMGGEPTFVAVGDRDAAEWNTDALGPASAAMPPNWCTSCGRNTARAASCTSARASGTRASSCRAGRCRSAGAPMASPAGATRAVRRRTHALHYTTQDAERFIRKLTARLGLTDQHIQPAYEDVFYYLWRERRLPVNVDPFDSRLDDEMERAACAACSGRSWMRRSAMPCRCRRARPMRRRRARPGRPAPGTCATTACTCCPATRPWATACRWTLPWASPGDYPHLIPRIRSTAGAAAAPAACARIPVGDPRLAEGGMVGRAGRCAARPGQRRRRANLRGEGEPSQRARWTRGVPGGRNRRTGSRAHGAVRGSARPAARQRAEGGARARRQERRALRLHAAAGAAGGLPRAARRRRGDGRGAGHADRAWKAIRRRATPA